MLARLPRPFAIAVIALFAALTAWCLLTPTGKVSKAAKGGYTDMMLFRDIVKQVDAGTDYYNAATTLQRAHHYPTKPFVTVREPTLYVAASTFGWSNLNQFEKALRWLIVALWLFALPAPIRWFEKLAAAGAVTWASLAPIATSLTPMSEAWCGLLLGAALALRLWPRMPWWAPIPVVAAALAIRELALPFLLLSAAFALWERRWKEVAAWVAVLAVFAAGLALHAGAVNAAQVADPLTSPGWSGALGLRGVLLALANTTMLHQIPMHLALVAALLPALGWLTLDGRRGAFAVLLLFGYALMIALFSRSDNFYWGFTMIPAWFAGAALVPRACLQLYQAIRGSSVRFGARSLPAR